MQIFIQASAEEIWEALTTSELLSQWWDRIRSADWRVGGLVVLEASSGSKIDCEVLEIEPNRRLVTTFDCDAYPEHPPTRVTWEIEPVEGGCLLLLIHDEFPSVDKGLNDVCQHWPMMIADLKRVIECGNDSPIRS
jgi:uncharacterized protein YndB with AHSA1/START domain